MKIRKLMLLVATLAVVLGIGSSAVAQVAEEPAAEEPAAEEPTAEEPAAEEPAEEESVAEEPAEEESVEEEPVAEGSCADVFRDEQIELAERGVYPTSVSDQARACEDSGVANPYPAPYFYDDGGLLYTYDPVRDHYVSSYDEAAGVYYVYDLVSGAFYAYEPAGDT